MNYSAEQVEIGGDTYTIIQFTRAVTTTDQDDLDLNQEIYILYAWGIENNFNGSDPNSIAGHAFGTANLGFSPTLISILCAGNLPLTNMYSVDILPVYI